MGNRLENDAEFQRRKTQMTSDEKARDARDRLAKVIHEQSQRDGKDSTFDSALRKATEIAELANKKKG